MPAEQTVLQTLSCALATFLYHLDHILFDALGLAFVWIAQLQVGLISLLWRHYSWPAMAEARKILGGAGPAIAAVPASLLWAGISIVELGRDVATQRVGATAIVPRLGFYAFTATGQVCVRHVMSMLVFVCSAQRVIYVRCCRGTAVTLTLIKRQLQTSTLASTVHCFCPKNAPAIFDLVAATAHDVQLRHRSWVWPAARWAR